MPTVPTVAGPQVGLRPTPGARQGVDEQINSPLAAFGGGQAAQHVDISPLAEQAKLIFQQERQKADNAAVMGAAAQLSSLETKLTIATRQKMGQDALSAPDEVGKEWQDQATKIKESLSNDTQRSAFDHYETQHWANIDSVVQHHVADQTRALQATVADAYLTNELNAGLAAGTPDRVEQSITNQKAAVADHLRQVYGSNIPAGVLEQEQAAVESRTNVAYVNQLLDAGKDLLASQYFQAHKSGILGSQLGPVEKALEVGSVRGESQKQADAILLQAPTLEDGIAKAHEIQDPAVRDATEERVRRGFADRANQQHAEQVQSYDRAGAVLDQTHDVTKIAPSDWVRLTEGQKQTLRAEEKRLRNPGEGPGDPDKYLQLLNEAYFNPQSFSQQDILKVPNLNQTQRASLMGQQRTVGDRGLREELGDLQKDVTRAEADAQYYLRKVEAAKESGDEEGQALFGVRHEEAQDAVRRAAAKLEERKKAGVAGATTPASAPNASRTPATPQMLQDIATKGPGYAAYLRSMGIDAPLVVIPPKPAAKKK